MGRLIQAEFLKLSKSLGYKILLLCSLGMSVLLGCLLVFMASGADVEVNGRLMYLQAIADIQSSEILAIIFAAVFVGSEFSNRTFVISIMSGSPRPGLLLSKAAAYLVGLIPVALVYPVAASVIITLDRGFGETNLEIWVHLIQTTGLFLLGIVALGSFCLMISILIKNVGGTIGAGTGALMVLSLLSQIPLLSPVMKFTFPYQIYHVAELESLALYCTVIGLTTAVTLLASVYIFKKTELK